jgi:hypothetical protein
VEHECVDVGALSYSPPSLTTIGGDEMVALCAGHHDNVVVCWALNHLIYCYGALRIPTTWHIHFQRLSDIIPGISPIGAAVKSPFAGLQQHSSVIAP